KAASSRSKAFSADWREVPIRHTTNASKPAGTARTNRSIAKILRVNALRISLPRRTAGAPAAGPDSRGSPGMNAPQRRQRQASPDSAVCALSWRRTPASAGAYVTCPLRPQASRLQSTPAAYCVVRRRLGNSGPDQDSVGHREDLAAGLGQPGRL